MPFAEFRTTELADATPAPMTEFAISVHRETITHRLRFNQVTRWATGGGKGPNDALKRTKVKQPLGISGKE